MKAKTKKMNGSSFFGELRTELSSLFPEELKVNKKFIFGRELELVQF